MNRGKLGKKATCGAIFGAALGAAHGVVFMGLGETVAISVFAAIGTVVGMAVGYLHQRGDG